MKNQEQKLLIIVHEVFEPISEKSMLEVLTDDERKSVPKFLRADKVKVNYGETRGYHWRSAMAEQRKWFESETTQKTLSEAKKRGDQILYFGKAPISLAIHLGHLFGNWSNLRIFLKHPDKVGWGWPDRDIKDIKISPLPETKIEASGDVVIRLGTSFKTEEEDTRLIVPKPVHSVEMYADVDRLDRDIIGSHETIEAYGTAFRKLLDRVADSFPEVNAIHLFAAIPVGLAFRLGQSIADTIHPKVITYEYYRDEQPPHQETFPVQEKTTLDLTLTEEDEEHIIAWRKAIDGHLKKEVIPSIRRARKQAESNQGVNNWLTLLNLEDKCAEFQSPVWQNLTLITDTTLEESQVVLEGTKESNIPFFRDGGWWFPDLFLKGLLDRLKREPNQKDLTKMAARLFFHSEMLHYTKHGISVDTLPQLKRYSQILAEADYQADVYALLHEYDFQNPAEGEEPELFEQMIDVLTESMWAADTLEESYHIEVRRLNRYLVWYYQQTLINSDDCKSIQDVLKILAQKPLIELKLQGLSTQDDCRRVMFNLRNPDSRDLGIAIFENNRIEENRGSLDVPNLIKGFYERRPDLIKKTLSSFTYTK